MARRWTFTNDLSAGELAPDYMKRSDAAVRNRGAKTMSNVYLQPGGGFKRRWGTRRLAGLDSFSRLETIGYGSDDARLLLFSDGGFAYRNLDGSLIQTVSSCPWSENDLRSMQIAIESERFVATSRSFFPQLMTLTAGSWGLADFAFATGLGTSKRQPYYRLAPRSISIQPDAYTGSGVDIVASSAVFLATHVGTRIRYAGIEIEITAVTNSTNAVGTVIGSLYPTMDVTVASSSGFLVGQSVSGLDSETRGIVSAVPSGTVVTVQLLDSYISFLDTEKLIGPTAQTEITSSATNATPAATVEWDEQLISAARGYPGACILHRARLLLGDFPQAVNVLCASAIGEITDFDVGTGADNDAIVEKIGSDSSLRILHFGSTEQLLIFTEAGPYYVPEQVAAPLSPTNLEILHIGPEVAGDPRPHLVSEGMLFTEESSGRMMVVAPTGNVRRSWDVADLSELAFHLVGTPIEMEIMPAGSETDRLVIMLRDDGEIRPMTYRRGSENTAWVQWSTDGYWESVVHAAGNLYVSTRRVIGGVDTWHLEVFDPDVLGDGVVTLATTTTPILAYAGATVTAWKDGARIGSFVVDSSGVLTGIDSDYGQIEVGFDFDSEVELVPPIDGEFGLKPKQRICRAWIDVADTGQFKVNGYRPSGYAHTEGIGGAIDPFTGQLIVHMLGHQREPSLSLTQDHGEPLEVRSITMEVSS